MLRKSFYVSLCVASLSFTSPLLAAAPFSHQELKTIQQYLYDNITSKEKVFNKIDNGNTISSRPGAVLASPSNVNTAGFSQDYQFHWARDAGITMREVVKEYEEGSAAQSKNAYRKSERLSNYIAFEKSAQQQPSYPGEQTLGQPKFNIDSTVWEGPWGRPQNDGPAIRSLALCEMAHNNKSYTQEVIPLIKTDLDYVVQVWRQPNFDLWEEVKDSDHFFTKMMQHRALTCAANLLYFIDQPKSKLYTETAKSIHYSLARHWNERLGYITETVDQINYKGGGLDSAIVLAVLYGNELSEARYIPEFSVLDDRVMSTVAELRDVFAHDYPINQAHPQDPPLIGRYPGDVYDGGLFVQGNPWVLTTVAMAEYYYSLADVYYKQHITIEVTPRNYNFFKQIGVETAVGDKYKYNSDMFNSVIASLIHEGDRYLQTIKRYQVCDKNNGCLHYAEQIDAKTGRQTSARDLTWGYVSLLRAMRVRERLQAERSGLA